MSPDAIQAFIRANLPSAAAPGLAQIRLHRAGPNSGLHRLAEIDSEFGSPYWAYSWGGGLALARHVLDHPEIVAGRRVLDLGAGCGVVAIAAARAGALEVAAADVSPYAIAAVAANAALNQVTLRTVLGDLTAGPAPDVDLVLVGDLFYESDLARRVITFLERCSAAGVEALIGDPWREPLPRQRLRLIAEYEVVDFGDAPGESTSAGVFALA